MSTRRNPVFQGLEQSTVAQLLGAEQQAAIAQDTDGVGQGDRATEEQPGSPAERTSGRAPVRRSQTKRTGTQIQPYRRLDGIATVKVTFAGSVEFNRRLRVFCARLPAGKGRNEWIELALTRAMDREERKGG
jgi:hypothetical protein